MISKSQGNSHVDHQAGIAAFMDPPLYEALSTLIRKIYDDENTNQISSVLLTSTQPKSGVSYLSSCMATLVAAGSGATILVDGQSIMTLAKGGCIPCRSECTQIKNTQLWVLGPIEASRVIVSKSSTALPIGTIIEALVRDFQIVIIDSPALSESSTTETLAQFVDGSILVVIQNITEMNDVISARAALTSRGGQVLGAIYNTSFNAYESIGEP